MAEVFQGSPSELGYRMPAEWMLHSATWLSWPHNLETWPRQLAQAEAAMVELVAALAPAERVHINVLSLEHASHVQRLLGNIPKEQITLRIVPTNDAWVRDHGAIFAVNTDSAEPLLALKFQYNAWGGKYPPFGLDQRVAEQMGGILEVPVRSFDMVLEGGSIEVNGEGLMLTTEQCLLNLNRNPTLNQSQIESTLQAAFGVDEILWLGEGIDGDDTDGHVDDLTRFVAPTTIVTAVERNKADPNFAPLAANQRRLNDLTLGNGRKLEVIELPMPEPQFGAGQRLPASFANFYIGNESVLVPVFSGPEDDRACAILADCFPGRRVVPIDCRALVAGLGTLHCLTQQVPAIVGGAAIS